MNITKFDITVLIVMGLAVVSMSFVFPALGLSDTSTDSNDIPELNVSSNTFNLAGDAPEFPNSPSEGDLDFNTTIPASFSQNSIWLEGDTSDGVQLTLIQDAGTNDAKVILTRWNGSVAEQEEAILNSSNPRAILSVQGYDIAATVGDQNNPPDYLEVDWTISSGSENTGFLSSLFGGAAALVDVLAWFVIIFIWFSTFIVEFSLNAVVIAFNASSYFIELLMWLVTTYGSIVSAAPSWTKVFVALPGIILSATLGKILVIFIGLLPTT